ncbi:MAG: hypothetical protein ABW133_02970, partial [Polyangiaceae bacterium]
CKEGNKIVCDKIFKCWDPALLEANKGEIGLNAADCVIKFEPECIPEKVNCAAGKTYHGDKMAACIDGYKAFTCTDIMPPITDPAACDQICTTN